VRISTLTAVFFADITPRYPRIGCSVPPIERISVAVAISECGVAQTAKQMAMVASRYFTYFW